MKTYPKKHKKKPTPKKTPKKTHLLLLINSHKSDISNSGHASLDVVNNE